MQAANYFKDDRLSAEVQSAILVFSHNKKFKGNLLAAKEFLIYKKIDEILWQDWDPIGINDMSDARDEYDGYVSQLFNLKKSGSSKEEIAKCLFKIEKERIGLGGSLDSCLKIADKIIRL